VGLEPGLVGRATLTVADGDTAIAMGSGDVPVLATPRLVALCEQAACSAVEGRLEAGLTTVGMRIQFDHMAPTVVGGVVSAEATLERAEGRRLTFTVSASDRGGLVGAGKMTRAVVEKERFLKNAASSVGN